MKLDPVIFREYDIRGVVGEQFDEEFAYKLGQAFATYLGGFSNGSGKNLRVVVGYDVRLSSPSISAALRKGLVDSGCQVLDIGLVTTPMTYFSTFALPQISGAIMVTGSHNPPNYNGFKISRGQSTIFGAEIQRLKILLAGSLLQNPGGREEKFDIFPVYIERYKKEFYPLTGVDVVLDCGNGSGGIIVRQLYEAVGLKPHILFEKPDGTFPNHHPDPTVEENLTELAAEVKQKKAHIGIGFDGDADRIGVVDNQGRFVFGDEILAILSRSILQDKSNGKQKIVGDVKCSDRFYRDIEMCGGVPIMWKTGHSLIKEKIKVEKAPFGGELSGHIFFSDRNYGYDDAPYAGLRLIEILAKTKKTIPELLEGLPPSFATPEIRIDTTEELKNKAVAHLIQHFSARSDVKTNLIDGIRISYPQGWALVRASNTQPVLVMRFESDSAKGLSHIRGEIEPFVMDIIS